MSKADPSTSAPDASAALHPEPTVLVGQTALQAGRDLPEGAIVEIGGVPYYQIEDVDGMAPFFVTVVSASDHWLFASSTGALTAGRGTPDQPLFPYETVDKIHDAYGKTGGLTVLLVQPEGDERWHLWEPFSPRYAGLQRVRRHLAKSLRGDRLRFEEQHEALGLTFAQTWATSEQYGFVRSCELVNASGRPVQVRLLDGVQNLMPYGISLALQNARSVLGDAYKRAEQRTHGLGVFALSAQPVDRAEPSEALLGTTVWQTGLDTDAVLLSTQQLDAFRHGRDVEDERLVRAKRGAYFVASRFGLAGGDRKHWDIVADIEQDAADVVALEEALRDSKSLHQAIHADVEAGRERLRALVGLSDGEQETADEMATARHRMNTLFNVMRGGVFDEGYTVHRKDVRRFIRQRNRAVADAHADWFDGLPETLAIQDLRERSEQESAQLQRLVASYLPLHFSRRHGDPSRPWNLYSIETRAEDGGYVHSYEGNWRDIFQNWEALGRSFPGYLEHMVATFVGASTADGYNPYRITDEGIDWETIEPDDPWSYIGYWGDHQIIYLLRLLVLLREHAPDRLREMLNARRFGYANVPYRIRPYAEILQDPQDTVLFDDDAEAVIGKRVAEVGADGKMLWGASGGDDDVLLVTLAEKLLVPLLAKLSNFIPGGGIWMNTQRPEWNDANNALVGNGVSVVTLFAVRRYVTFLLGLLDGAESANLSREVADLLAGVAEVFGTHGDLAERALAPDERRAVVDALGEAGGRYREQLYSGGLSGDTRDVAADDIRSFLRSALGAIDQSLRENRRDDGLVHSYNLLGVGEEGMTVSHLYPMLEGQVAALDSGVLASGEAIRLLKALRESEMYRADQHSYRLYPDRSLADFVEKNTLPPDAAERAPLLQDLLSDGDTRLVVRDVRGGLHFDGRFRNRQDVEAALDTLAQTSHADAAARDRRAVLDLFEEVFDHTSYTGRSGTFFGFEGLGSIYWHMVSKLALASQETFFRAEDAAARAHLADAYYDIRGGLGGSKTPAEYGAFPADAYSHTPGGAGAKQPGMTGQVKEDILCRWGELGVVAEDGRIAFRPALLREAEYLEAPTAFRFVGVDGALEHLDLEAGHLAFTYCSTPVVYRRADALSVRVIGSDGAAREAEGGVLSAADSAAVFGRTGAVVRIEVDAPPAR